MSAFTSIQRSRTLAAALLAFSLAGSLAAGAQSAPDVHQIAQRVDDHYNRLHSLRAGFTETYQGLGVDRTESGTLLLEKPGRMRWDYNTPAGKLFLLDGKFAFSYTPGAAQVQRIPAKQLDDLRSPLSFLLGHTKLEKELTGLTIAPGANGDYLLTGHPRTGESKDQQDRVRQVKLAVSATGVITAIEIEEQDGAITRFLFSNEQPNAPTPGSAFHFAPPPGVPVVDVKAPI
jgi:outer membrane lipoprotein carrier protein